TPNHPDLRFTGRVRESLAPALAEIGFSVEGLPYRIRRGAREHDESRRLQRAERNLQLVIREMNEIGPIPRLLNCLAEAHQTLGQPGKAEALYRGALSSESNLAERLEAYYGLLVALEGRDDSRAAQVAVCLEALEEFPMDAHLLCAMGGYLQAAGHGDLAMQSLETAWRYGQIHPEVWHLGDIREIAAVSLSRCQELAGLVEKARETVDAALAENATSHRLHRRRDELTTADVQPLRNAS
ncbi:MAG: hypothetical protein KY475_26480, partial [Planctomycetes bacterium]|nr:hypothetical protein [Planctomycetota bacterium]